MQRTPYCPLNYSHSSARVQLEQRRQMKDKSYRATPVGGEVGRFLRSLKWSRFPPEHDRHLRDRAGAARLRPRALPEPGRVHDRDRARLPRSPLGRCGAGNTAGQARRRPQLLHLGGRRARAPVQPGREDPAAEETAGRPAGIQARPARAATASTADAARPDLYSDARPARAPQGRVTTAAGERLRSRSRDVPRSRQGRQGCGDADRLRRPEDRPRAAPDRPRPRRVSALPEERTGTGRWIRRAFIAG